MLFKAQKRDFPLFSKSSRINLEVAVFNAEPGLGLFGSIRNNFMFHEK